MNACIFVGPTLRREEVQPILDGAVCLPPAVQGDIYKAGRSQRPRAIAIIDGCFCGAPSVWQKEILWALSEGIHVFGSASMGALRAAELHTFGMRGVGRIFEAFRDGTLEDDDEVAVVHGPAEIGFLAASEPMVNIRVTLERAEADGVLIPTSRRSLEALGKSLFFSRRSWTAILDGASLHGVGQDEIAALRGWLPRGQVDQKREDALAMLTAMKETLSRPEPFRPAFRFERTHFWYELIDRIAIEDCAGIDADRNVIAPHAIIEELRLQGPDVYGAVKAGALVRLLAGVGVSHANRTVEQDAIRQRLTRLRAEHGLYSRAALDRWLEANHLGETSLEGLLEREVRAEAVVAHVYHSLENALIDELRLTGSYQALAERAQRKKEALAARGIDALTATEKGVGAIALRMWFFSQRLGRPMPDDIGGFVRELGFASLADFDCALQHEQIYLQDQQTDN
jgi:hypothetical protein